jgi:hypothetical protein
MKLTKYFEEKQIWPERSTEKYTSNIKDLKKRRIDIVLEDANKQSLTAIELKMPMNGQAPLQMFSFVKDIYFLEQLKRATLNSSKKFDSCFFIAITNDVKFWEGDENDDPIYSFFRGNKKLKGTINCPVGKDKKIINIPLHSAYDILWQDITKAAGFKYLILEIK